MTIYFHRRDFNAAVLVPPPRNTLQKPACYGIELHLPARVDKRAMNYMLRLVWTKLNQGDTALYDCMGRKTGVLAHALFKSPGAAPGYDPHTRANSQYECILLLQDLIRHGAVLAAVYPSRDVAETKREELEKQAIYGRDLPARVVKIS